MFRFSPRFSLFTTGRQSLFPVQGLVLFLVFHQILFEYFSQVVVIGLFFEFDIFHCLHVLCDHHCAYLKMYLIFRKLRDTCCGCSLTFSFCQFQRTFIFCSGFGCLATAACLWAGTASSIPEIIGRRACTVNTLSARRYWHISQYRQGTCRPWLRYVLRFCCLCTFWRVQNR